MLRTLVVAVVIATGSVAFASMEPEWEERDPVKRSVFCIGAVALGENWAQWPESLKERTEKLIRLFNSIAAAKVSANLDSRMQVAAREFAREYVNWCLEVGVRAHGVAAWRRQALINLSHVLLREINPIADPDVRESFLGHLQLEIFAHHERLKLDLDKFRVDRREAVRAQLRRLTLSEVLASGLAGANGFEFLRGAGENEMTAAYHGVLVAAAAFGLMKTFVEPTPERVKAIQAFTKFTSQERGECARMITGRLNSAHLE